MNNNIWDQLPIVHIQQPQILQQNHQKTNFEMSNSMQNKINFELQKASNLHTMNRFGQQQMQTGYQNIEELVQHKIKEEKLDIRPKKIQLIPLNEKQKQQEEQEMKEKIEIDIKYKQIFHYEEKKNKEKGFCQIVCNKFWTTLMLILAFAVDVFASSTIIYPSLVLLSVIQILNIIKNGCCGEDKNMTERFVVLFFIIQGCLATIYLLLASFYYLRVESVEKLWYVDALIFFLSTVLVCSYIKNVQTDIKSLSQIFRCDYFYSPKIINTMFMSSSTDEPAYVYDCVSDNNNKIILDEYQSIMKQNQIQEIAQRFNLFSLDQDPLNLMYQGFEIVMGCNKNLPVQLEQFFTLITIMTLKSIVSVIYFYLHSLDFSFTKALNIVAINLFYINMSWCLNKVIGNYDLRRKVMMMDKMNGLINFRREESEVEEKDEEDLDLNEQNNSDEVINKKKENRQLLDVTDTISFEAWDNTRKFVLGYFSDKLWKLEFVYICLFFYYIFVTVMCVIAYGEFYSIIPQDSIYLHPLMIIQNTFNFIYINTLLLWRIYQGQMFNNTFEESEDNVDYLIDMAEDLIQLFDSFFLPSRLLSQIQGQNDPNTYIQIEQRSQASNQYQDQNNQQDGIKEGDYQYQPSKIIGSSIYGQIVQRIKYVSDFYIKNQVYYLGVLYDSSSKRKLQKQILKNMLNSYKKVKTQIVIDSKSRNYKFLHIFQLNFFDILTTLTIAFLSVLPNVIPKLIDIFQSAKKQ